MKKKPAKNLSYSPGKIRNFLTTLSINMKKNHLKRNSKLTLAPIEVALAERIIPSPGQT